MRDMVLAMLALVAALAFGTALDQAGVEQSIWLVVVLGAAGGLAGGVAMDRLMLAAGRRP